MKRRTVLSLLGAGALGATAPGRAAAQSKMVLKASDVHPLGYPTVEAVQRLGKKLDQATNGRLTVQMFPSMQLGGEKEALEQAQVGALAFARVSVGVVGSIVDEVNVFNLPFVFRDVAHMRKVIDGEIGKELLDKITTNPQARLIGLCWMDGGSRNVYNTKRPVRTVEDLKGLKIRMMGNPLFVETMNALGGNGVAMGMDQVYSALQTGVVDGAENNPPSYDSFGHYTIAKHYSMTEHLIIPEILVFSKRIWDGLSKDDQELIRKFSAEAQLEQRQLWDQRVAESMKKIRDAGIEVVTFTDKKPFQDAVKPVWDKYGAKHTVLVQRIQAIQ
ncbi:TRAP transporter substrate-binding protein [Enterovirga aerilata]|uniref:TRAP transporter substrate-binding protein n=1 Tax=Enterovirga aerilata TaxID=2730920 RepID=A0A849I7T0_9HYPH|nr:TRAP transporter substrate-binding protein [Enterovirga sp. DB1703]NNM73361.1 TRAP transporter substrate-binding protein [Enterovirga sp. DB1703]